MDLKSWFESLPHIDGAREATGRAARHYVARHARPKRRVKRHEPHRTDLWALAIGAGR